MTKTGAAAQPPMDLDTESVIDTIRMKSREITIALIVLAAAAVLFWWWKSTAEKTAARAETVLNGAENSFYGGNDALAQSDLQKLIKGYANTPAGVQGSILLAQLSYKAGKYDDGIKVLTEAQNQSASKSFAASLESLIAAGYADAKKYDEAVKHFRAAADKAEFATEKDMHLADAARTLALAGKKDEALKIWQELSVKIDSPVLAEAKLRVGELTAVPATK
ncbi:MAG: tetratricopeptide repeat protein [Gemmatimonadetes bacterium]|nr:tetratricopeptide repeat protein [Gemmatimonadota bacterium]